MKKLIHTLKLSINEFAWPIWLHFEFYHSKEISSTINTLPEN